MKIFSYAVAARQGHGMHTPKDESIHRHKTIINCCAQIIKPQQKVVGCTILIKPKYNILTSKLFIIYDLCKFKNQTKKHIIPTILLCKDSKAERNEIVCLKQLMINNKNIKICSKY